MEDKKDVTPKTTTMPKKDFLTGLGIAGGIVSLPIIALGVLFVLCCCCCMFFSFASSAGSY